MRQKSVIPVKAGLLAAAGYLLCQPAFAEDRVISLQEVLRDPSNIGLNLDYAEQEIEAGDLLSAAAALERVLISVPDANQPRLLYAIVLFRMDDRRGAAAELSKVSRSSLSPADQLDYDYYSGRLASVNDPFKWDGQLVAGLSYDDNILSVVSDTFGFLTEQSDTSAVFSGRLALSHELSEAKDLRFVAAVEGFTKRYFDADGFDYSLIAGEAGLEGGAGRLDWSALLAARTVLLEGDTYLEEFSVNGSLGRHLTPRTRAVLSANLHDRDYNDVTVNGFSTFGEEGRSGDGYAVSVALEHQFDPRLRASLRLGWAEEDADFFGFDYDGLTGGVTLGKDWAGGVYTDLEYAYQQQEYSEIFREDDLQYARASVGLPLRVLAGGGKDASLQQLEAMTLELAVFSEERDSDLFFFDYDNTGVDLRLVWAGGK